MAKSPKKRPKQTKAAPRERFPIGATSEEALGAVGQSFERTRERVRKIEAEAMRKLHGPHARVLLFLEDGAQADEVAERLEKEGYAVNRARSFFEAVPHLSPGGASLMLVYLPATDFVRNTFLAEARQAAPQMPIIAIAQAVSAELRTVLARFGVQTVLPVSASWPEVVAAVRGALEAAR